MGHFLKGLTSPWVLLSILVIPGGMWLVNNLWIVTDNLNKPYALLAGPVFVGSILLGCLFFVFFKAIMSWCKQSWQAFQAWRKQDGSTFWLVIYIFLVVSVLESGTYFNGLLGSNSIHDTLGYAAALVIDLIAVECMRARLGATRMRDKVGKRIYLTGVIACAGLSAWANTYTSLAHYQVPTDTMLPGWMVTYTPWTGMAFPLLIILMSFAAEYTADQTSTKLDPENYKIQEKKRIDLLEIQKDMLKDRVRLEDEIDQLSTRLKKGKSWAWFSQKNQPDIAEIVEEISQVYEPQIIELKKLIEDLKEDLKSQQTFVPTIEKVSCLPEHETFEQSKMTDPLKSFSETDPNVAAIPTPRVTGKLDPRELKTFEEKLVQRRSFYRRKSGPKMPILPKYLYTKKEAAKLAKCSDFEIELALKEGELQLQKNGDKILKSSLADFIVARQKVSQKSSQKAG